MSKSIGLDYLNDPSGKLFRVSTIKTFAGGGGDNVGMFGFIRESDFAADTPWPFETVIFEDRSDVGLYHAAYETEEEALRGHQKMVETIKAGLEFGGGVKGPEGNPSLTPEEWRARCASKEKEQVNS